MEFKEILKISLTLMNKQSFGLHLIPKSGNTLSEKILASLFLQMMVC